MNRIELNFNLVAGMWQADFKASGDFCLHIERSYPGAIALLQKSIEDGRYANVEDSSVDRSDLIIDTEVQGFIAPKWLRIVMADQPTLAVVVSESDIEQVEGNSN